MAHPSASKRADGIATVFRWAVAALIVLAVGAVAAGGWHFSDILIRPHPNRPLESGLRVAALDDTTITLVGSRVARAGSVWFLEWPGGSGVAGKCIGSDDTLVTCRFRMLEGRLTAGDHVDLRAYPYSGDPLRSLGMHFEDVYLATASDGPAPAWFVPAGASTWLSKWNEPGTDSIWVVIVHGMNASRGEGLRVLPALRSLGLTSLTITYHNDPGAPRYRDGLSRLGWLEANDLHDYIRQLPPLEGGHKRRVILVGYSMGGALIAEFLRRSPIADRVAGVVLDAPVMDWSGVVERGARREGGLAPLLLPAAKLAVASRIGFSLDAPGEHVWRNQFPRGVPVLLFHGTADETVPIATSEAFARALGQRVTLVKTAGAGHVQSWNYDPAAYDSTLVRWLSKVVRGPS